jgi:hypothetical protein
MMPTHWKGIPLAAVHALHLQGLADAEIARLLHCPLGTVETCRWLCCHEARNRNSALPLVAADELDCRST